jgi:hypothetical protein
MLNLNEYTEIHEKMKLFEGESTEFTDQQLDDAEFYQFKLNPVSYCTEVTLYNVAEEPLGTVSFEDADIAIAFIEELFDLEPEEAKSLENYDWANPDVDYPQPDLEDTSINNATVNNID